jgi:hypothetical protein
MRKPTASDHIYEGVQIASLILLLPVLMSFLLPVLMTFAAVRDGCRALLHRLKTPKG